MPRARFQRRRLSLTSLIDVIFLLLLFFMLSSTFSRFAEVELAAAAPGTGEATAPPLFLQLRPDTLSLDGDAVELGALAETIGARGGAGEGAERTLLVSLGDGVSAQRLTDLLGVLRGVPGLRTTVLGVS